MEKLRNRQLKNFLFLKYFKFKNKLIEYKK